MDKISEMQYKNLRECFCKNLVKPILGNNYYNMAMDVYNCDEITTLDIKRFFDLMKSKIKHFFIMLIISSITNIVLGILILLK